MKKICLLISITLSSIFIMGCDSNPLSISCTVTVPEKFRQDPPDWKPPNGEPESIRYITAYEAFWWNCVMVKAEDIEGRCPFTCSGTPAASDGCSDGAINAENQISQLFENHDVYEVTKYLKVLAQDPASIEKLNAYFPDGPRAEIVSK